jgi:hypothetical protein
MSEREARFRAIVITYFPMFIATLSLVTSIYNGYLNARFVDIIQRNLGRAEYMRTCKDVIDAYFQVKFRASVISRSRNGAEDGRTTLTAAQLEGENAVVRLGALGTYLANLRDESTRVRYTELSRAVTKAMGDARLTQSSAVDSLFEPADRIFAELNADCVKSAMDRPM